MARFNVAATGTKTENLAGGEAFSESPKLELASILLTSFANSQFYRSETDTFDRVRVLIRQKEMQRFAAQAAIYARTKFGMRSITHVVAAELSKVVKGETWMKNFVQQAIYRPDDATEILSYYLAKYKKPIPNALKKGIAAALEGLNDYQMSKYRGESKGLKMVDVVNLVHPRATETLTKLMKGELKSTETWEAKLSKAGQTGETDEEKLELKGAAWKELLLENKLGYFALLRNLRNIEAQAPEMLPEAHKQLTNAEKIKKSLVLPFRFQTALKTLQGENISRATVQAIAKAMEFSLANVPIFPGKTLVVLDCSGSMQGRPLEIGSLFASILYKTNEADMILFGTSARYVRPNPMDSAATIAASLEANQGGTNFHAIFECAVHKYDRMIILSDMQGWIGHDAPTASLAAYRKRTGADPKVYSLDLQGYGSLQFPQRNIFCLAGFSEKIFDLMKMLEEDRNALVNTIEAIKL